jgi:exosortase A
MDAVTQGSGTMLVEEASPRDLRSDNRFALLATLAGALVLALVYLETSASFVRIWSNSDLFGHGFLILPIAAWLVWRRVPRLLTQHRQLSWWGIAALGVMNVVWLLGNIADVNLVRQVALVGMIQGLVLAILGWRMTLTLVFPLGYLYFAVPAGEFLVAPLQQVTADFVVRVLRLTGIPVFIDGLYLQTPTGRFLVAEACSGARFLISTLALGSLGADIFFRSWSRRVLFMLLATAVPIVANGFRAYGIVIAAHFVDPQFAASADHITFGLIFMSFITLLLLLLAMTFRERSLHEYADDVGAAAFPGTSTETARIDRRLGTAGAFALAMLVGSCAPVLGTLLLVPDGEVPAVAIELPNMAHPWRPTQDASAMWRPQFIGASAEFTRSYSDGEHTVTLYAGYYAVQRPGAELINGKNRIEGGAWGRATGGKRLVHFDGREIEVNFLRMLPQRDAGNFVEAEGRVVWYWYSIGGHVVSDPRIAKLFELGAALFGGDRSASVFAIAADYVDDPSNAAPVLQSFLAHLGALAPIFRHSVESAAPRLFSPAVGRSAVDISRQLPATFSG